MTMYWLKAKPLVQCRKTRGIRRTSTNSQTQAPGSLQLEKTVSQPRMTTFSARL
jgi:hypothetical protein